MNKPVTVFVDSGKAVARLSSPLVLGDTYAVAFSGLSTEESASAPEMIVLGPKPREIAARSGESGVLAMTTTPCVEAFGPLPPPPLPRPKQFPHPPPLPNPPVHWRGGPHGSTRMHFYVVAGGQTLAQGDLVLLWAPFEFDEAGEPIQLRGKQGEPGKKGDKGDRGEAGRNGVYVAMDGLFAFHISEGGDHPEDGHLWLHARDEGTLYAHDANGNYLLDENGERIPLYYVGDDGHLRYRFFFQDSTHVELDLGRVVTRAGLYAFHVSDGSDGEPEGHLMLHGQDLSQLYARDGHGELILDGDGNPIPLFHIDGNGHLHFTFYGNDGQAHESLDLGDVRGPALRWEDLTDEQKEALKGAKGDPGDKGDKGDALTWSDLTPEQKASLKGEKGDPGRDGMDAEQITALVRDTMGNPDDRPVAGSPAWVTSGGLWSVEQAILARLMALATRIDNIRDKVGGAYHYKGTVASASALPSSADVGDVWNVASTGMNYAWTGSEWDALGGTVDLSAYLRTADLDDAISSISSDTDSWFYNEIVFAIADARDQAADARRNADEAVHDAADAASRADQSLLEAQSAGTAAASAASAVTALDNSLASVAKTGAASDISLPSDVHGQNLGEWVSQANRSLGMLPTSDDILCQNGGGLLYRGVNSSNLLTEPPRIGSDMLALAPSLASEYAGGSYAVGEYCTYTGQLYRCTTAVSGGPWDGTKWVEVSAMEEKNLLPYASTTTLSPGVSVYRSSLNADGTFPTVDATAIPTTAAYYQFELELTVPSTVPATITGPSGWTWLDGHGLPDPADLVGGETICISVRLDCTARTFLASVWRVA